jgi:hypothetical protein
MNGFVMLLRRRVWRNRLGWWGWGHDGTHSISTHRSWDESSATEDLRHYRTTREYRLEQRVRELESVVAEYERLESERPGDGEMTS